MPWSTPRKDEAVLAALTLTAMHGDTHTFELQPSAVQPNYWRVISMERAFPYNRTWAAFFDNDGVWNYSPDWNLDAAGVPHSITPE